MAREAKPRLPATETFAEWKAAAVALMGGRAGTFPERIRLAVPVPFDRLNDKPQHGS
jgi:hypothetical protein